MLKLEQLIQIQNVKKNSTLLVFILLLSFLIGNIFGLNSENLLLSCPGVVFFIFPVVLEALNSFSCFLKQNYEKKKFYSILISFRRGFLLGIFIEAFKVGS
jgi:hypothetical protein